MNLKHLYFFRELAYTEHMAKAAENLSISQPSLSYAIEHLESDLGVPLFEKDGRNIRLTAIGKIYLNYVESSLTTLNEGKKMVSQLLDVRQGHVDVGFTYTLGQELVPELVTVFQKDMANKSISFNFYQNNTEELVKKLIAEKYDMVFSSYIEQLNNESIKTKLAYVPVAKQELVLVTPRNHPLAKYSSIFLNQLGNYPFINFSRNSGIRPLIDKLFQNNDIHPNVKAEIEEDHAIVGFVQHGYGIALIPHLSQLNPDLVHIAHIKEPEAFNTIYLISKADHFLPPSTAKFKSFAINYCDRYFMNEHRYI